MRVVRYSIRAVAFALAVVIGLLICQLIEVGQYLAPFGAQRVFTIDTSHSIIPKEELVGDIEDIASSLNATIVKVVADPNKFQSKRDIFWFGGHPPVSEALITEGRSVVWFDSSLTGDLLEATELGDRTLAGEFRYSDEPGLEAALTQWAERTGVSLTVEEVRSTGELAAAVTSMTGIGNACIAMATLLVAALIAWFVSRAKARSLKLMGGISSLRIHVEDCLELVGEITVSALFGVVTFIAYIGITRGPVQLPLFLHDLWLPTLIILGVVSIVVVALSVATRPTVRAIAARQIPLRAFGRLGTGVRFVAVALAVAILPSAILYAQSSNVASEEQGLWEGLRDTVRVSLNNPDVFDQEKQLADATRFFAQADEQGIVSLSYTVDTSIVMTEEELGEFDHLVIVDGSFLKRMEVGIQESGNQGRLDPIVFGDLDAPMQEFVRAQFPLWMKTSEYLPNGVSLNRYVGSGLPSAGQNVGLGGETVFAKSPLVVVVESPATVMNVNGFLVPAMSSGNIFFTDAVAVRELLIDNDINQYVASIDHVADLALDSAQGFAKEAGMYSLAIVLLLVALIVASVQSAQLWAGANERRVFALHSAGISYREIVSPSIRSELVLLLAAGVAGGAVSLLVRQSEVGRTLAAIVAIAVFYTAATILAYRVSAQQAFGRAIYRKH